MRRAIILPLFVIVLSAALDGHYSGSWASDAGVNTGKVTVTIGPLTGDSWPTELVFTYQDQAIKSMKVTTTLSEDRVSIISDEEIDGIQTEEHLHRTTQGQRHRG
jgi:hypothetical protein